MNRYFLFVLLLLGSGQANEAASAESTRGLPLASYCEKYLEGATLDLEDYGNFLKLYRAAVEISAKAHSNAQQTIDEDGLATYQVYPAMTQRYAGERYTIHLIEVEAVLRRFGYLPREGLEARLLKLASRLHDTAEDTPLDIATLQHWFGNDLAGLVYAVKKVELAEATDKIHAKALTLTRILSHRLGTTLKLADRIANVEQGLRRGGILPKYLKEYAQFRDALYRAGENEAMWAHLDYLLKHQSFPEEKDYWALRLAGLSYEVRTKEERKASTQPLPSYDHSKEVRGTEVLATDIHFMQSVVADYLDHKKYSLIEMAHDIHTQQLRLSDLTPLEVWRDTNGKIWTLNQRRLAMFRLAGYQGPVAITWITEEEMKKDNAGFSPWQEGDNIQIRLSDGPLIVPKP